MLKNVLKAILLCGIFFYASGVFGAIQLDDADATFRISEYGYEFFDASGKNMDIQSIIKKPRLFKKMENREHLGFGKEFDVWFKFTAWNVTPENRWVLFLIPSNTTLLEMYYLDENRKLRHKRAGVTIDDFEQEIQSPFYGFYLDSDSKKPVEYYIRMHHTSGVIAAFYIVSAKNFAQINKLLNFIAGIVVGMMALLFFFNLGMFIGTRQTIFLSYIGFISLLDLILLHEMGVLSDFIGYWELWFFKTMPMAMPIFLIAFLYFAKQLTLLTKEHRSWILWVFFILMQIPVLLLTAFVSNAAALIISWLDFNVITIYVLAITGRFAFTQNNIAAKIAFAAWVTNFILLNAVYLTTMNVLPLDPGVNYIISIFFTTENIIMSWVLVIWWNEEKDTHRRTLTQLQEYRFRTLQNRMSPHFLYNALNIIYSMIDGNFFKKASNSILSLADMYKYMTDDAFEELIPLQKEIVFVKKYLTLTKESLGDKLVYKIDVDKTAQKVIIPPMCIQPLVENSIKHGRQRGKPLTIELSVQSIPGGGAKITVKDNGVGLHGVSKAQTLNNIKERISMHYANVSFKINNNETAGVKILLTFTNLKNKKRRTYETIGVSS